MRDFSFLSNAAILIRCHGRIMPTRFGIDVDKRTELSEYGNVLLLSQLALDLTGSSGEMRENCNVTAWLIGKGRLPGSEAECKRVGCRFKAYLGAEGENRN